MSAFDGVEEEKKPGGWQRSLPMALVPYPRELLKVKVNIRLAEEKEPWTLVVGPHNLNAPLLGAIARLGEAGPVQVLDGGNRFNAYLLARAARGRPQVLNRVTVSRAFTCYQVLSLLESTPAAQEQRRIVILDLLSTFYDESVQAGERKRLLGACLLQLERLAGPREGPDVDEETGRRLSSLITVHPPKVGSPAAVELLQMLEASPLVETFFVRAELPPVEPPRLF